MFGGKVIEGLSLDKGNKSYYCYYTDNQTGKRHKKYFGRDIIKAVKEFGKFTNKNESVILELDISKLPSKNIQTGYIQWSEIEDDTTVVIDTYDLVGHRRVGLREDVFWDTVGNEIRKSPANRAKIAQLTGIEQIAYLDTLKPPVRPLTLQEIGNRYFSREIKPLDVSEKADSIRWWTQFSKIIGVTTIRDITFEHLQTYQDTIWSVANKKKYSPTYIKHRFDKVKTILNYVKSKIEHKDDFNRVLEYCLNFVYPAKAKTEAYPIKAKDFKAVLAIADIKHSAIFLLAANIGAYAQDIRDIKKTDIDLKSKTLRMYRGKTSVIRVASLWNRTVQAIQAYQNDSPDNNTDYLFISRIGTPYRAERVRKTWEKLRPRAKIKKSVKFEHIRDAAATIPFDHGESVDTIKLILGHKVSGITDDYIRRSVKRTINACQILEQYYFGQ